MVTELPVADAAARRRERKVARAERRSTLQRLRWWHPVLLLPLVGLAAWLWIRAGETREDPADVLDALRARAAATQPSERDGGSGE